MKTFDFTEARKHHTPEMCALMEKYYKKGVSEDEWVALVRNLPPKPVHNSRTRSPSSIRSNYRKLNRVFGFFKL